MAGRLTAAGAELLVDVRRFPASRRHPHLSRARTAVMCSESVWWRCHRRMVADAAALLHDVEVLHLMPDGRLTPHPPTAGVRVAGDVLVYDA